MADKIGVLGETTNVGVGAHVVYQVPTGKAARIRPFYRCASGTNSTVKMTVNGIDLFQSPALTVGHQHYSSAALIYNTATAAAAVNGTTEALTAQPYARDFWLAAGDTLTITVGTADLQSNNAQAVGTEVDVTQ